MKAFLKVRAAKELQCYNRMAFNATPIFSMSYLIAKVPSNRISQPPSADPTFISDNHK